MKNYKRLYYYSTSETEYQSQCAQDISPEGRLCGEGYFVHTLKRYNLDNTNFSNRKRTMGFCIFCGEIDWMVLQEHHPYPIKLPNFKVTLCANCHARLHYLLGGNKAIRKV